MNKEEVNSFSLLILLREPIFNSLVWILLYLLCLCRNRYTVSFKIFPKVGLHFMLNSCPEAKRWAHFLFLENHAQQCTV